MRARKARAFAAGGATEDQIMPIHIFNTLIAYPPAKYHLQTSTEPPACRQWQGSRTNPPAVGRALLDSIQQTD
jgi:hypothetical protein